MAYKKSANFIMEQIKDVDNCLICFESFVRAATTKGVSLETLRSLVLGVYETEDQADRSLRAMIDSLMKTPYLPSTREDIIAIATKCDRIANICESISKTIVQQRIILPEHCGEDLLKIIAITKKQFSILEEAIILLFNKLNALQKDHSILDQIRALETEVDIISDKLETELFNTDEELARKLQLSSLYTRFADISDIIEDIADEIQIILIARKA